MSWLPDYAMFNVLRRRFGYASWNEWPKEYAQRKQDALTACMNEQGREIAVEQVIQFFFDEQWCALQDVLHGAGYSHSWAMLRSL